MIVTNWKVIRVPRNDDTPGYVLAKNSREMLQVGKDDTEFCGNLRK